ncbi:hydroxyethylthiazole kinase [Desulfonispora thiosulfatigenes DSM 11270]|uniref:Hydroxyethylthiazole kinase n=1 Tax=Desulfonispora thiosulfatigenes DSM 11270 TaxID=656914 RepID=A0A1W1V3Y1_DESTI|nr:hydroxyethylthiazole kinase [Desulfonispora thiosulfatigenes]SMB88000.1 hydroxyethylthiazole kinase [Desulfonispora thiosulfatigenes DSM 11270]
MEIYQKTTKLLIDVREKSPLVHHITNYVTVNDCANIVLALGGSPVMADDEKEVKEMTSLARALVLNIGTLNTRTIDSMIIAGKTAKERNIPIILDPVGVGATKLRTQTAKQLLAEVNPTIIRGNMSEIKILAGIDGNIKGVDSMDDMQNGKEIALELSHKLNAIVAITGKIDIISNGTNTTFIANGHKLLSQVTGTGCMCSSLVGTYAGVTEDYYSAAIAGILSMGLAGEKSFNSLKDSEGVGTFRMRIFDNIYNLTPEILEGEGKIHEE